MTCKFEKLVTTTVMNFLKAYDETTKDIDEDYGFDKLADQVAFEIDHDGFMIMRIDGDTKAVINMAIEIIMDTEEE